MLYKPISIGQVYINIFVRNSLCVHCAFTVRPLCAQCTSSARAAVYLSISINKFILPLAARACIPPLGGHHQRHQRDARETPKTPETPESSLPGRKLVPGGNC